MSRDDWLFDDGRWSAAAERIYAAATELIYRDGMDAFSVDALAARTHCSRATIYRYVGGKKDIREAVLARAGARIVDTIRVSVEGRAGADRVLTAIEVAVAEVRAHPASQLFLDSARSGGWNLLTTSQAVAHFASELTGVAGDDPPAAQWIVRLVLSLLLLPATDARTEHEMLQRFVAPAFANSAGPQTESSRSKNSR
ncbi:transcriptional regulator [Mycobacterium sp. ACS1612]|uniref:TetR/AcrR family transcriptional regulator n=1 Tax=Mycobacterium sp. ACS1612 TaxID=1834117 RepID=UPI000800F0E3|nr:helix-turn-helix domain-containing protein [Mycobacterium sp. ACS1612]OBF29285.1 transcriptional regulator [Mycobacterium sp. ACS1612]